MGLENYPLISIVIPYYNPRFDYFKQAIESVLAQSYVNWEAIIVNDGSSSESKRFLEEHIDKLNEKRISIHCLEKNHGPSVAKNIGVEKSKGEIITFLDTDDIHLPWLYKETTDFFNKNPDSSILAFQELFFVCMWNIRKICLHLPFQPFINKINGSDTTEPANKKYKTFLLTTTPRLAFRKAVFKKIKFDPEIIIIEDTDLCLQIINNNDLLEQLLATPIPGYLYRIYPSQNRLTHRYELRLKKMKEIIIKYKDSECMAKVVLDELQNKIDDWKFCGLIACYLNNGSFSDYLKETFLRFPSNKDRLESIRFFLTQLVVPKFLINTVGVNSAYIKTLLSNKKNNYRELKQIFLKHLENDTDLNTKHHLTKIFESVF